MGEKSVLEVKNKKEQRNFMQFLLNDIAVLGELLERGLIESDIQRIGAEQELCFVDKHWKPVPIVMEVLDAIGDSHFTTELAKFNMEINLDPVEFTGKCLSDTEKGLLRLLYSANQAASEMKAKVLLTGILPTIRRSDLCDENMTPLPRYLALDKTISKLRGEFFEFRIKGVDELITKHSSTMFEASNTSYQVHLQIPPNEFVEKYNWAQAISGPVLAACTNSPLLFGKRLWRETRIAMFQQSLDTRNSSRLIREQRPRVSFGNDWVKESPVEIFQEDIARYRTLLNAKINEDAMEVLEQGGIPNLNALRIHNGTIYRWNRACYGISDTGLPHLRIENRYIPAGPSVRDEIANSAFWLGLMNGMPDKYRDVSQTMNFEDAKMNFLKAAHMGLGSQLRWLNGRMVPSHDLLIKELLPLAYEGLEKAKIDKEDIDKYLSIIKERIASERTGSQWMVDSFVKLCKEGTRNEALVAITAGIYHRQKENEPVHRWKLVEMEEGGSWENRYLQIEQIMSTDLFVVQEEDLLSLVSSIMDWRKVRHVPVEDERGELKGLLTSGMMVHYHSRRQLNHYPDGCVRDIMIKNPMTVQPETPTTDALRLMRKHQIGCLPVVDDKKLVGIVTEHDFVAISEYLLNELENHSSSS